MKVWRGEVIADGSLSGRGEPSLKVMGRWLAGRRE